ncbi:uncharacterized protein N7482_010151 [Penicillium canariense]|uniref:Peptidase M4 C-terminal domain-containing protein n=1 Tax=Penicillium canariense TaxID=189055 RepID=A0A9W9HNK6_9EURO|nr:uncharacterized protein N7482_010151 [Penicillium canariense]KAJ5150899.1 hypothetical protein N7482_010151 [Penicillium canariense]
MASMCCIVPEHVLERAVEARQVPQHILNACQSTLEKTRELQNTRVAHGRHLLFGQEQQPSEGIVPPYIHEIIARQAVTEEQRDSSLSTVAHDTKYRVVAGKIRRLNRTIYNAHHSMDEDPARDKIMIKEGGPPITKEQDPSYDANECYNGFQKTYDFYFEFFKRDSIDDRGLKLDGFVHYGDRYLNAFWNGKEMVFGDGDGVIFNGFTDELDVIGHELTHGVVQYTMGKQSNWLIAEGIWGKGINGRGLRDMKAPGTAYDDSKVGSDPQPAHWKSFKKLPLTSDRGGVHINSGIPNRAFYLASTMIGGYSWETAGPVWYKALTSGELSENATFREFAELTIRNAGDYEEKIREAWKQVGYPFVEGRDEL